MRIFSLIFVSLLSLAILPPHTQAAVPTATNSTITMNEDSTYTFSEADFGYFDADDDVFTSVQITTLETAGFLRFFGSNVTLNQKINVSNLANLTFKSALNLSGNGYSSFQFTVNDGVDSSSSSNTITIDVLPVDDPPFFSTPPLSAIDEDSLYDFTPTVDDVDSSTSPLIFSIENQPAWITTFDTDSGRLSGTPENDDVRLHSNIILTVEDSDGLITMLPTFSITVNNTNDAPTIGGTPATSINEDSLYTFMPNVIDVDAGDTKIFSITNKPGWANFNTNNGTLSGTPTNKDAGVHANISISVTDSGSASDTLTSFKITVININDAPTFTNSPPISINEDTNYNFTLTATDVDSIVGELVFSITPGTSLPDWLNFVPSTGVLSSDAGRPHNGDVGTYNNISFTVTDDNGKSTSLPLFSITVVNVNDSPTGSIEIIGDHKENSILSVSDDLADEDGLGAFRYQWQRNGINVGTSSHYLLGDPDVGQTISITISYTDGRGTDEPPIGDELTRARLRGLTGAIHGVNDPVLGDVIISGQPHIGETLTAENTLSDADGLNTFSYEWKRNGTPITTGISNTYLLSVADEGQTITATIHYTDGQGFSENKASIPTAQITTAPDPSLDSDGDGLTDIYEIEHGLDPNVSNLDVDGDGVSNQDELDAGTDPIKDDYPPANFTVPADKTINSTGLVTAVDPGVATAVDGKDGVITAIPDNSGPFRPGIHAISWTATDAAGNPTTASTTQTINVIPMVNFAIDQISNEGSTVTVSALLNGKAPVYPVTIPFSVSGSAVNPDDHDLNSGDIIITAGLTGNTTFDIVSDATAENDETVTIAMETLTNAIAGNKTTHTIIITELTITPKISLKMKQNGGLHTSTVVAVTTPPTEAPDENEVNEVVVTANIVPALTANVKLDWSKSDNTLIGSEIDLIKNTFTFDPGGLNVGTYTIVVDLLEIIGVDSKGEDITNPIPVTSQKHRFKIVVSVPVDENHEDKDDDGIANQYDEIALSHVIALQQADQSQHLVETEPGLQLRLGAIAFESNTNGLQVSTSTIETYATSIRSPNDNYFNVGGLFDFEIHGLSQAGDSALVVIPLRTAIPTSPHYRKLMSNGWQHFIVDEKNTLTSASGSNGSCPPPNSSAYRPGLTPGHLCVQLLLEDGGSNDADGVANGAIIDPSGIAVAPIPSEQPSPPQPLPLPDIGGGAPYGILLLLLASTCARLCRGRGHAAAQSDI
ncbi:MAG: putative Ig domain-containing protein [Gammaproteobacteria bacterium]|nr:putative Ig domain-containing protein [Gammaproteobacteria bacterium]